jgi:hypothetical protein
LKIKYPKVMAALPPVSTNPAPYKIEKR